MTSESGLLTGREEPGSLTLFGMPTTPARRMWEGIKDHPTKPSPQKAIPSQNGCSRLGR